MQYMGVTDAAHEDGSEQIYLPVLNNSWRATTKIGVWDPTHPNVPAISPGEAAAVAYGHGFGDTDRGQILYEGGHDIFKDNDPANIAAVRIFFNFSLMAAKDKGLNVSVSGIPADSKVCSGVPVALMATVDQTINAAPYIYAWSSSCGGTFSTPSAASTNFTPPNTTCNSNCTITCKVTDACGREAFFSQILIVNELSAGTIGADQLICTGTSPEQLTETMAPTSACNFTYQWQSSTTSCASGFTNIGGANSANYSPGILSQTTYFRRIVTIQNGSNCSQTSNCVTVSTQVCCEFTATCPANTNLGTYNCNTLGNIPAMPMTLVQLQAAPYNITLGATPCGQIRFTVSDNAAPNVCSPMDQTITRTIVVWDDLAPFNGIKDVNEPSTTCTFTYVVQRDATKPVFTVCPPGGPLGCNPTIPAPGAATATDNCGGTPGITSMLGAPVSTGGCGWSQTRTYTATDACGNTETCEQVFTYTLDMTKPVFTFCPPGGPLGCNPTIPAPGAATATDNCGGMPNITSMLGTPVSTGGCGWSQTRTYTATDACGNTETCEQVFTYTLDMTKPVFTFCPPGQNLGCNPTVFPAPGAATATDNCGGTPGITSALGPEVNIGGCNRTRTRTYTATDACGNTETCAQVFTYISDNTAPVFTSLPAHVTVQCNAVPGVGNPIATDNCSSSNVSYLGETSTPGSCPDAYTLVRTWQAVDYCGNTRTATQRITVIDSQKPAFTNVPANITVQCDAVPAPATPTATDNCDADVEIIYTGETRTNGSCPNAYTLTRRWTARDNCSNTVSISQRITVVDNGKPVLTVPANTTIACNYPVPPVGTPSASDACGGNVTIVYLGQTTANATCPGTYQIRRTWRATDVCGNSTAATQTIQVVDNQPPVFSATPANVTINCQQSPPPLTNPTATDGCGGYVQITYLGQVRTDGNCLYNYTLTRTWRATDLCGNSTTKAQVITVQDIHAPTFTNPPADLTVVCAPNCVPFPVAPNAIDNCGAVTVTLAETQSAGDCTTGYTVTRTWTATDQCSNPKVHVQTITVLPAAQSFAPGGIEGKKEQPAPWAVNREQDHPPLATQNSKRLTVNPNPTSDWVLIGIGDFVGENAVVSIYNELGQLVWEQRFDAVEEAQLRVNLRQQGASAGLYTVTVRTNGQTCAKRLVLID